VASKSKYHLHIKSGDLSGTTGHHSIVCCIEESRGDGQVVRGIDEVYGIEVEALKRAYNGNIYAWRDWVGKQMLAKHKIRMAANREVLKWRDQKIELE
jgi:hypothetical protein